MLDIKISRNLFLTRTPRPFVRSASIIFPEERFRGDQREPRSFEIGLWQMGRNYLDDHRGFLMRGGGNREYRKRARVRARSVLFDREIPSTANRCSSKVDNETDSVGASVPGRISRSNSKSSSKVREGVARFIKLSPEDFHDVDFPGLRLR